MNLATIYAEKRKKQIATFKGMTLSDDQLKMYRAMREHIAQGKAPHLFTAEKFNMQRGSGKTTVLLKLAKEFGLSYSSTATHCAHLQKEHPDIDILPCSLIGLRGRQSFSVIIDEVPGRLLSEIVRGAPGKITTGLRTTEWEEFLWV